MEVVSIFVYVVAFSFVKESFPLTFVDNGEPVGLLHIVIVIRNVEGKVYGEAW